MTDIQMNKTKAEELAGFVVDLRFESIPFVVVDHARYLYLDLLGAALAGVETPEVTVALKAVKKLAPSGGPSRIWGTEHTSTPGMAALVNGITAHARELDDFGGVDHTGAVVIPALMAVVDAFEEAVTGERFIEAMVAGYEVGRRVLNAGGGYRPHNHEDGFHSTGSCGSFAAAAAVAKLLGLNAQQTTWAIGLAGSFTGGTWAFTMDGAMSKRYHVGRAAETGVTCAYLAQSGFTGPAHIFEAEWGGFLTTYLKDTSIPEQLTDSLWERWDTLRSGIKPYAACRDIHSSLDVIFEAMERKGCTVESIEKIEVLCIEEMKQMIGSSKRPQNRFEAQLSLPYSIGVALTTGRAFLSEFDDPYLSDDKVWQAASLVEMTVDASLPYDCEPYINIFMKSGECIEGHVSFASGAPQNPLGPPAICGKFRSLASMIYSDERVMELEQKALSLNVLNNVQEISSLLKA